MTSILFDASVHNLKIQQKLYYRLLNRQLSKRHLTDGHAVLRVTIMSPGVASSTAYTITTEPQ